MRPDHPVIRVYKSRCFYCRKRVHPFGSPGHSSLDGATRDHVQSKALGGRMLGPSNIVLSCRKCNQEWANVEHSAKEASVLLKLYYRKVRDALG